MKCKRTHYDIHINIDTMDDADSQTLSSMLSLVSPKLNKTLSVAIIGDIVTSEVTNGATDLQIAPGLLTRDSEKVVDKLYDYRVTCSYDEMVRFRNLLPMLLIKTPVLRESLTRVLVLSRSLLKTSMLIYIPPMVVYTRTSNDCPSTFSSRITRKHGGRTDQTNKEGRNVPKNT